MWRVLRRRLAVFAFVLGLGIVLGARPHMSLFDFLLFLSLLLANSYVGPSIPPPYTFFLLTLSFWPTTMEVGVFVSMFAVAYRLLFVLVCL